MDQPTVLLEMSVIVRDWIREMDSEPGPTLRSVSEEHGWEKDYEKLGEAVRLAFMGANGPFLALAPNFLKAVFDSCVAQVDWAGVARVRMRETEDK